MSVRDAGRAVAMRVPSFATVVAGEWLKLRTMRSTWWLLAAFVIVTAGMGATSSAGGSDPSTEDLAGRLVAGLALSVAFPAALGAVAATSEWSSGLARVSLVVTPNRTRWVLSKAAIVCLTAGLATVVALGLTFVLSMARYANSSVALAITDPDVLVIFAGAPVFVALMAGMALGMGVLLRHSGGAVSMAVGLLFVAPLIVPAVGLPVLTEALPTSTGLALMGLPSPLNPAVALVITLLWAAIPLAAAIPALKRRGA
ncbi:hypothetical protein [Demequina lignilytica]|uniref:ABC-2 type transport system permease protein n=1 Tax=Demequina lignilytica TaxID=3051663 RepID=A0AB35MI83_9MICO|nr:hypothetical protein [Demequina sp. SYSU T0a273]MDN4483506.1 hypothetical protein [Demequina sp. SYSU T0a273]